MLFLGVCINGVVMDIAIGKKGSAIYVGGNFVLCNSRNSALANFVVSLIHLLFSVAIFLSFLSSLLLLFD